MRACRGCLGAGLLVPRTSVRLLEVHRTAREGFHEEALGSNQQMTDAPFPGPAAKPNGGTVLASLPILRPVIYEGNSRKGEKKTRCLLHHEGVWYSLEGQRRRMTR
jgi:hypothetical protein